MNKIFLLILMLFAGQVMVRSQNIEITPFGGYVFPARWHAANGSLYFNGNALYGGMISLDVSRVTEVNFSYHRIDTKVLPDVIGYSFREVPVSQNYYMIGFTKNFRISQSASPFVRLNLGGLYLVPKSSDYYSYWFFAMGLDAGVKLYFSKRVGLLLQAELMMPIQGGGFSFYYGTGGGGTNAYVNATLVDFGVTGGFIFRLGRIH